MAYLSRRIRRLIAESELSMTDSIPGANLHSVYRWDEHKGGPILAKVAAILDALGYELEIVPKKDRKEKP